MTSLACPCPKPGLARLGVMFRVQLGHDSQQARLRSGPATTGSTSSSWNVQGYRGLGITSLSLHGLPVAPCPPIDAGDRGSSGVMTAPSWQRPTSCQTTASPSSQSRRRRPSLVATAAFSAKARPSSSFAAKESYRSPDPY